MKRTRRWSIRTRRWSIYDTCGWICLAWVVVLFASHGRVWVMALCSAAGVGFFVAAWIDAHRRTAPRTYNRRDIWPDG